MSVLQVNWYTFRNAGPLVDRRADSLNPLGFSPLWFEPSSDHMWESQVLLMDGQVVFSPGSSGFRPTLMNDRLDISEGSWKDRKTQIKQKILSGKETFSYII